MAKIEVISVEEPSFRLHISADELRLLTYLLGQSTEDHDRAAGVPAYIGWQFYMTVNNAAERFLSSTRPPDGPKVIYGDF